MSTPALFNSAASSLKVDAAKLVEQTYRASKMSTPCLHCKDHTPVRNQYYAKHLLNHHPLAIVKDNVVFVNELKRSLKNKRAYVCYSFKLDEDDDDEERKKRYCCFGCGISTTETYIKKHIQTHPQCAEKHYEECTALLKEKKEPIRVKVANVSAALDDKDKKIKALEKQLEDQEGSVMYTMSTLSELINKKPADGKTYRYDKMFHAIKSYFDVAYKEKGEPDDDAYEGAESVGLDWQFYEDEEE